MMTTPVDPVFLALPYLVTAEKVVIAYIFNRSKKRKSSKIYSRYKISGWNILARREEKENSMQCESKTGLLCTSWEIHSIFCKRFCQLTR